MLAMRVAAAGALQLLCAPFALGLFGGETFPSSPSNGSNRLFSFSKKRTRLRVELTFAIPFVSIPIGGRRRPDDALVDVNLGALGAGAVFSLAALLFIPQIFDGLHPEINFGREEERQRGLRGLWGRVDAGACAQRALCSLVAEARDGVRGGNDNSVHKIVDGVTSNAWLVGALQGTAVSGAIDQGRMGANCSRLYDACLLPEGGLQGALDELSNLVRR
ncbi:Uncharacterized protein GBIM_13230 [Gryllus bimaculatus]|nr:Uncharacterized protein GBIM_13230 [Gryllus bimaculatus]